MRRFKIAGMFVLGLLLLASSVEAQFSGQLSTARTLPTGKYDLGGYFGVYDGAFAFFGQFRGGVSQDFDLGMKLGVINIDPGSRTGVILSGDLKYQILDVRAKDPFDLSIGAGLEFFSVSDFNTFSFGANFIGSYDFDLSKGRVISPYGRLNLRGQREHTDFGPWWMGESHTDTDFHAGLNPGVSLKVSNNLQIIGELQFDDNFGFIGGLTYSFY